MAHMPRRLAHRIEISFLSSLHSPIPLRSVHRYASVFQERHQQAFFFDALHHRCCRGQVKKDRDARFVFLRLVYEMVGCRIGLAREV